MNEKNGSLSRVRSEARRQKITSWLESGRTWNVCAWNGCNNYTKYPGGQCCRWHQELANPNFDELYYSLVNRSWYAKNVEYKKLYNAVYRGKNREREKERSKKYYHEVVKPRKERARRAVCLKKNVNLP